MSLDQVLNELQEGITNTATEHAEVLEQPNVKEQNIPTSSFKINSTSLNQSIIKKINNLYDLGAIRNAIHNTSKVDYKVAQEVFTMLPDASVSDRAKVTAAPSIINKEILDSILKTQTGEYSIISYQLKVDIDKILEDITNNSEHMLEVGKYVESFLEQVKEDADRLTGAAPIVIYEGNTFNLFTRAIYDIYTKVNDNYLHYDKYQDVLNNKYYNLLQDETFKKCLTIITTKESVETISLFNFITVMSATVENIKWKMTEFNNRIDVYNAVKGSIEKEVTQELVSMVNSTELIYQDLLYFKDLHEIIHTPNNVFDKVLELVKFLD